MSLELFVYLAGMADGLKNFLELITFLALLSSVLCLAAYFIVGREDLQETHKAVINWALYGPMIALTFGLLTVLTPSTKTIYTMAAISLTKEATASEMGQRILKSAEEWAVEQFKTKK